MRTKWVPRTLRVRLTAWHVGVMVVVLAIYASVVLLLVTRNASATIDAQIRERLSVGRRDGPAGT